MSERVDRLLKEIEELEEANWVLKTRSIFKGKRIAELQEQLKESKNIIINADILLDFLEDELIGELVKEPHRSIFWKTIEARKQIRGHLEKYKEKE